jgi:thiamine biosynthesis lipoprotein
MFVSLQNVSRRAAKLVSSFERARTDEGWLAREEAIMATAVRVELWSDTRAAGENAINAVMREMHRIEREMSPFRPESELSRVNREAAERAVPISAELFGLIARALEFSALSGGAFDITFSGVGHLYDYRRGVRPSEAEIERARAAVGYRHLLLDHTARTIAFARPGVRIDLGGFAKGYAVDRGAALLAEHGIEHAIVTAGGDSHVLGDRRGRPWTIGIRDPRRADQVVALLPLENTAISTSGDYERYFERDGERCHHIIDPATGKSPTDVHSVTILASSGLVSEAMSKTLFVLGLDKGMRLIESLQGIDAVVVDAAGKLHYSSGLLAGNDQPLSSRSPDRPKSDLAPLGGGSDGLPDPGAPLTC